MTMRPGSSVSTGAERIVRLLIAGLVIGELISRIGLSVR
jgi:hypothetical protein